MEATCFPKPPYILVYTGEDPDAGPCPYYENIAANLKFCLNPDCYFLYLLSPKEASKDPWTENVTALVVSGANSLHCVNDDVAGKFAEFAKTRPVVSFCTKLNFAEEFGVAIEEADGTDTAAVAYKDRSIITLMRGNCKLSCTHSCDVLARDGSGTPVIAKANLRSFVASSVHLEVDPGMMMTLEQSAFVTLSMSNADRLAVLKDLLSSHLGLNCDARSQPKLTPCYLFCKGGANFVADDLLRKKISSKKLEMFLVDFLQAGDLPEASDTTLPVYVNAPDKSYSGSFNKEEFFENLNTKSLGHNLFVVDVVGTTMDVIENLQEFAEPVVVALQQVQGRGRGRNVWISPRGCAMFSTHFTVPLCSALGQRLPLIQFLVALAAIEAVRKSCGYDAINVRLKWPNDIYWGNKIKIGGVIAKPTVYGDRVNVFTGCGVNIANSKPTLCMNDAIRFHNANNADNLPLLSVEKFIACSLNEFERLVADFQTNGPDRFFSLFYSYWLHANQKVTLKDSNQQVLVVGIDDHGYLLVQDENCGQISLQPDGNSFDQLKNLIYKKEA